MSKRQGGSLVQYIIILLILVFVVVLAYGLLGKTIVTSLSDYSNWFKSTNNKIADNLRPIPGSLGGTMDEPVKQCNSNSCTIDFGDFILTGIPDNITNFVETSGAPGGIDTITNLLMQLADQLDDPSTPTDESQNIRDLANLGHLIANIERESENRASECLSNSNPRNCYYNSLVNNPIDVGPVPADLAYILPNFSDGNISPFQDLYHYLSISLNRNIKDTSSEYYNSLLDKSPATQAVEKFKAIQEDNNLSDNAKAIIEQLYRNISSISDGMLINTNAVLQHTPTMSNYYDPVTGAETGYVDYSSLMYSIQLNSVLEPQPSLHTDLDSAIICATGMNSDTGQNCYNK